jgi:replicative DNA helicase
MPTLESSVNLRRIEAERNFAAAAFVSPDAARDRCGWLLPVQFRDERIGHFWEKLLGNSEPTKAAFELGMQLDILGWVSQNAEFGYDPQQFAQLLVEEAWLQNASENLPPLAKAIAERNITDVQKIATSISSNIPIGNDQLMDAADVGIEFMASIDNDTASIQTHIPNIDAALGGLWREALTVICARPSVGKTALGWQIARTVAESNKKVLFFSFEMSRRNLWARAVCGALRIPYRDVVAKKITQEQRQLIQDKTTELIELYSTDLIIDDKTGQTTTDIWKKVAQYKPDVVIVDHLRLCADTTKENEVKRQGTIAWNLKRIAKEFGCASVVLAQLSRKPESRDDKRPTMSDLRDSGEIEENADIVLGIHREREYLERPLEKNPADLIVLKFRDGPSDLVMHMIFDGMGQWFEPADQRRYKL